MNTNPKSKPPNGSNSSPVEDPNTVLNSSPSSSTVFFGHDCIPLPASFNYATRPVSRTSTFDNLLELGRSTSGSMVLPSSSHNSHNIHHDKQPNYPHDSTGAEAFESSPSAQTIRILSQARQNLMTLPQDYLKSESSSHPRMTLSFTHTVKPIVFQNSIICVIGGTQFLGQYIVENLLTTHAKQVIVFDLCQEDAIRNIIDDSKLEDSPFLTYWQESFDTMKKGQDTNLNPSLQSNRLVLFHGNILVLSDLLKCFSLFHVTSVIHSSSIFTYSMSGKDQCNYNILGTQNVLESCFRCRIQRLIYTSNAQICVPSGSDIVNATEISCVSTMNQTPHCPFSKVQEFMMKYNLQDNLTAPTPEMSKSFPFNPSGDSDKFDMSCVLSTIAFADNLILQCNGHPHHAFKADRNHLDVYLNDFSSINGIHDPNELFEPSASPNPELPDLESDPSSLTLDSSPYLPPVISTSQVVLNSSSGSDDSDVSSSHNPEETSSTSFHTHTRHKKSRSFSSYAPSPSQLLTTVLRPHHIFGPRDSKILPSLIQRVADGSQLLQFEDKVCDLTYVSNVSNAHVLAIERLFSGSSIAGNAFFITNNQPRPFFSIITQILTGLGYSLNRTGRTGVTSNPQWTSSWSNLKSWMLETIGYHNSAFESDSKLDAFLTYALSSHQSFSIEKATKLLSYFPNVTIEQGISLTIHFFRKKIEIQNLAAVEKIAQVEAQHDEALAKITSQQVDLREVVGEATELSFEFLDHLLL